MHSKGNHSFKSQNTSYILLHKVSSSPKHFSFRNEEGKAVYSYEDQYRKAYQYRINKTAFQQLKKEKQMHHHIQPRMFKSNFRNG